MGQALDAIKNYKDPDSDFVNFKGNIIGQREEVNPHKQPTFDPMLGFPNGRKERKMELTVEQMDNANIPSRFRTYCAHKYLDFSRCHVETPMWQKVFLKKCMHVWHDYTACEHQQDILQAKEYERECRLLARQKRRIALGLEEDPNNVEADIN